MIGIIAIGLVLIILGIGATILYDKYKEHNRKKIHTIKTHTKTTVPLKREVEFNIKQAKAELEQVKKALKKQDIAAKSGRKPPAKAQQVPSNIDEQLKQLFDSMNIE
jgi:uncharacterized protein (DUF3084 family)